MYFFSFSLFNFTTDTDKCEAFVGKCHKEATCNNTNGLYVEMDATVQVQSIISEAFIFVLTIIMNFRPLLLFYLKHARSG